MKEHGHTSRVSPSEVEPSLPAIAKHAGYESDTLPRLSKFLRAYTVQGKGKFRLQSILSSEYVLRDQEMIMMHLQRRQGGC